MDETLDFQQIGNLVKKYAKILIFSLISGIVVGFLITLIIPKKFKSIAVLNVQNSYFHIPLVNDLITGTSDSEAQAQKDALFKKATDNDYLEKLGRKYNVFSLSEIDPDHPIEREKFRKKNIENFALNSTSNQIAVTASDAKAALDMTQELVDHVVDTLIEERSKMIERFRDSIQTQLDSKKDHRVRHSSTSDLSVLEAQIASLEKQYTPEHPTILALKAEAEALRNKGPKPQVEGAGKPAQGGETQLRDDLVRRLKYVDIALDIEKDRTNLPYLSIVQKPSMPLEPLFPKVKNFVMGGAIVGLLFGLIWVVFQELKKMGAYTPEMAAKTLGYPFIGTLPECIKMGSSIDATSRERYPDRA